jgi:hypothetical protein
MNKIWITAFAIAVLVSGMALSAYAVSVDGPHVTTTPIATTKTDWTGTLMFDQFNPALGSLIGVRLDLATQMDTVLTVTNDSPSGSSGSAKTELQISVQDPSNALYVPQVDWFSPVVSYTLAPYESKTFDPLNKFFSQSDYYTNGTILAEFTGGGVVTLDASTFTQTWLTNTGGNTFASQVTHGSLTGTVTYYYTDEVPEFSTVSLAAMFLPATLLYLKRRRA